MPDDNNIIDFELLQYLNKIEDTRQRKSLEKLSIKDKSLARWTKLLTSTTAKRDFENQDCLNKETISNIEAPMLCLYGELSHCLPTSRKIRDIAKECECVEVHNLGHFHPGLNPETFTKEVERFIIKNEGSASAND